MTVRPLTPEERREAIRYCAEGDENSDATARTVACAAHDAISETEFGSWPAAAALLSAGWDPGTMPTAGQIQVVAVDAAARRFVTAKRSLDFEGASSLKFGEKMSDEFKALASAVDA